MKALCFLDEEYPVQLRHITDFPVLLFVKGNLDVFSRRINVALVGTRKPSDTAKKATWRLGMKFSEYQCNIVSGLAMGCDTFAHESSITSGGKTLAVLPCGIYNIYPKSNIGLANRIIESGGAIVSEYPVMHKPHKAEYIERDRIISALSDIVTVVESGRNGGTIHTANYAIEQDKILACFQHSKYTEESAGNKMLIEEKGAIPISIEDDIRNLTELANNRRRVRNLEKLTKIAPHIEKQLSFFD
ncbi:MAG: DNA-processing protein DprA [Bacillota bacterium]|nr:DNA-processing protein DprA [Bacillota bacterium]